MKTQIILSAFLLSLMVSAFGQTNRVIDSLENILKTANADTTKLNCLNALSDQYGKISEFKMAMQYADSALKMAKTLDYKKGIANAYKEIGNCYNSQGKSPEALEHFWASLKIFEEIGDKKSMYDSHRKIGGIFWSMENFAETLKHKSICLKLSEEIGDKKLIASSYNSIGNSHLNLGNYAKGLENLFSAVKIYEEIGSMNSTAIPYHNIGIIYYKQSNYHEAIKYIQASIKITEELGWDVVTASSFFLLADVYIGLNNFQEARKYLDDGLALSKKAGRKLRIMYNYESLSTLNKAEGNFEQALEYYTMYILYKDSLWNEQSKNQIALMKTRYETEKKDREIELLNKDKALQEQQLEKQRLVQNGMIAGAMLLLAVGLLLFSSFRLRKKLEKQQAIIQERKRISADLHDDVGSGLSKITLLSEMLKTQAKTPENRKEAEKISGIALELSSNISEIIWALNSNNDYVENMVAYIRRYAAEYFENSPVKLKISTPGKILQTPINGEYRRNIFYTVKEALHNIMKHSEATEAELKFVLIVDKLDVIISDNGIGIPEGKLNRFGNGINNMRNRMKNISGDFNIVSQRGTKIMLKLTI